MVICHRQRLNRPERDSFAMHPICVSFPPEMEYTRREPRDISAGSCPLNRPGSSSFVIRCVHSFDRAELLICIVNFRSSDDTFFFFFFNPIAAPLCHLDLYIPLPLLSRDFIIFASFPLPHSLFVRINTAAGKTQAQTTVRTHIYIYTHSRVFRVGVYLFLFDSGRQATIIHRVESSISNKLRIMAFCIIRPSAIGASMFWKSAVLICLCCPRAYDGAEGKSSTAKL